MPITTEENFVYVCVVAGCLLEQEGKFLLVQEKKPKAYGLWNLPAGRVEKGFTISETAIKETKEESGYDVEITKKIGVFNNDGDGSVRHAFSAKIVGGQLEIPEDEILDAKWWSLEEIEELSREGKIRSSFVLEAIKNR